MNAITTTAISMSGVNISCPLRVFIPAMCGSGCINTRFSAQPLARPGSTNTLEMDEDVQQLLERRSYSQALERLLDLYETKVFRTALSILRNPARAEEATQDVFLKLWQVLPRYDGRAALGTWIYTIARNTCLSIV